MPPLLHTPTLQPRPKFCSEQVETSYSDQYARPIPKHDPLRYSFTSTVTEYQMSVHGCFSNLDGNRCFANGLLKCLIPRATKGFT